MATALAAPPAEQKTPTRQSGHLDQGGKAFNRLAATCVTLFALIWLVPLLWALVTSVRSNDQIAANPMRFWEVGNWNFDAYKYAWETNPLGYWYVNSFIISTLAVIFAVVLLTLWWTFGFNFILYTAAIQEISQEIYEAAAIDGAGPWQQIKSITVPLLKPTMSLVLILQVLASLKVFDQIYILLAGGPNYSTRPVIQYIYDTGFTSYRGGYAAAATMVYFVILVLVSVTWLLLRRRQNTDPANA